MEQLATNGGVAGEGKTCEFSGQCLDVSVHGSFQEVSFELLVDVRGDADAGVPLLGLARILDAAAAVADGVAGETDGLPAAVADLVAFGRLEGVVAGGRDEDEPVVVAEVLHVGQAGSLPAGPFPLGDGDAVFVEQFLIDGQQIFAGGNPSGDVPPVAVTEVADGQLLDEAFR